MRERSAIARACSCLHFQVKWHQLSRCVCELNEYCRYYYCADDAASGRLKPAQASTGSIETGACTRPPAARSSPRAPRAVDGAGRRPRIGQAGRDPSVHARSARRRPSRHLRLGRGRLQMPPEFSRASRHVPPAKGSRSLAATVTCAHDKHRDTDEPCA